MWSASSAESSSSSTARISAASQTYCEMRGGRANDAKVRQLSGVARRGESARLVVAGWRPGGCQLVGVRGAGLVGRRVAGIVK